MIIKRIILAAVLAVTATAGPVQAESDQGVVRVIVKMPAIPEGLASSESALNSAFANFAPVVESLEPAYARRLSSLPFMVMELDKAGLAELEAQGVEFVEDGLAVPYMDEAAPRIGAPTVWKTGTEGTDQAIAILDTGIDTDHPAFGNRIIGQACYSSNSTLYKVTSLCPTPESGNTNVAEDCSTNISGCGHGTHVAGIAAGNDQKFRGIAPMANIIAVQVFARFEDDPQGKEPCRGNGRPSPCALSFTSDQLEGLRYVRDLARDQSIAAVNMSLGGGKYKSACDKTSGDNEQRKRVIDQLRAAGTATVVASGNAGFSDAIGSPACISSAISVGNVRKDDKVASYSNSSSDLDLLAPGSKIEAAVVGGEFGVKSGTSMATPVVAGAFALLRSAHPQATVDQIFDALKTTGVGIRDLRNNLIRPRIDVDAAIKQLEKQMINATGGNDLAPATENQTMDITMDIEAIAEKLGAVRLRLQVTEPNASAASAPDNILTPSEAQTTLQEVGGALLVEPQAGSNDIVVETTPEGLEKLRELQSAGKIHTIDIDQISVPY